MSLYIAEVECPGGDDLRVGQLVTAQTRADPGAVAVPLHRRTASTSVAGRLRCRYCEWSPELADTRQEK